MIFSGVTIYLYYLSNRNVFSVEENWPNYTFRHSNLKTVLQKNYPVVLLGLPIWNRSRPCQQAIQIHSECFFFFSNFQVGLLKVVSNSILSLQNGSKCKINTNLLLIGVNTAKLYHESILLKYLSSGSSRSN